MSETNTSRDPRGRRHKRGYLPHIDAPGFAQFVTFRLNGSLPKSIFETLKFRFETKQINEIEYHWEIEKALDAGSGPAHLSDPRIADVVKDAIKYFDGTRYALNAWVIMPTHAHILMCPFNEFEMGAIMHSIKSFTAKKANEILGTTGRFWSPDYFDRFIRNREHFVRTIRYIENNPVKAGLCVSAKEWKWSSAHQHGE